MMLKEIKSIIKNLGIKYYSLGVTVSLHIQIK